MPKANIIEFAKNTKPLAGATEFLSLTTDLTLPEEELKLDIDKRRYYETRQAEQAFGDSNNTYLAEIWRGKCFRALIAHKEGGERDA